MESDWQKFRDMVPRLRERFLAERNARIARLLTDAKKSETERFWDAEQEARKVARTLRECLDGHSRSKMWHFMHLMLGAGMLKKEDLADFSEEARWQVLGERDDKPGEQGARANAVTCHGSCCACSAPGHVAAHL